MPGDILGVQRGCSRRTRVGSLVHGPDVSPETVEVKQEISGVERPDRVADGAVGGCRGVGFVHPVQDVAPARWNLLESSRHPVHPGLDPERTNYWCVSSGGAPPQFPMRRSGRR